MAENKQIPNSLYEKYLDDRARCYKLLWSLDEAIYSLSSGNVTSYSLGNRSVTYQDLQKLHDLYEQTENRIDELEAKLNRRSPRNITTNSFLDPAICLLKR